jgi:DNA repair protein RadC
VARKRQDAPVTPSSETTAPLGKRKPVREWPAGDRPRERLRDLGPAHLSTAELLAIILRTGTSETSVVALAQRLLEQYGGLAGLAQAPFRELTRIAGLGEAKVAQIKAALELGRRAASISQQERIAITSVQDAVRLLLPQFVDEEQERFVVVLLDTKHHVLGTIALYRGTLLHTAVRPAEVFRDAVRANCRAVLVAHNHPSGDPSPSAEDIALTAQLVQGARLLGLELLDHIIVARDSAVSLREKGLGFGKGP